MSSPAMSNRFYSVIDDALGDSDVVDLQRRLARREVSAEELYAAAHARVTSADAALNAVVAMVDQPIPAQGPFAGIPSVLKDNEELTGYPTLQGSRAMPPTPATEDSVMVEMLSTLGLGFVAKTTMPEFGLTATTEPKLSGPTRNPWSLDHSAGGSSGGSAALVSAGAVPLAHANDGGGSIRIPAACCGLVGLKPSRGMMPTPRRMKLAPVKIAVQGVLTRTVRDTAGFYAAVNPADPRVPPVGLVAGPGQRRLRIGVFADSVVGPVAADVTAGVMLIAQLLAENGHSVDLIEAPVSLRFGKDFLRYWAFLAWTVTNGGSRLVGPQFQADQLEPFTIGLSDYLSTVGAGVPSALARLRRFPSQYATWFDSIDVLLSPVLGTPAQPLGRLGPDVDFHTHITRLLPYAAFTAVQNVAGAPAISLPAGLTAAGLPLAVQIAGPLGSERTLLELAFEVEAGAPWPLTPADQ